jgi:hypothetical protein
VKIGGGIIAEMPLTRISDLSIDISINIMMKRE